MNQVGTESKMVLGPGVIGYLPKYVKVLIPALILLASKYYTHYLNIQLPYWVWYVLFAVYVTLSFVLWWDEVIATVVLALAIDAILYYEHFISSWYAFWPFTKSLVLASITVILLTEVRRHAIKYVIDTSGVTIRSGVIIRRERTIRPQEIKEIIVKKFPLVNCGHVVILTGTGLSEVQDGRFVEAGGGKGFLHGGVGYIRMKKKERIDPESALYSVRDPYRVKETILRLANINTVLLEENTRLLREISRNVSRET